VLDFFCGGETPLADGRLLSTGGTARYQNGFLGRPDTLLFDPAQPAVGGDPVHGARAGGIPQVISLGDGRVLAAAGLDENGHANPNLETFFPPLRILATGGDAQRITGYRCTRTIPARRRVGVLRRGHMDDNPAAPLRLDLTRSPATTTR